jgi:nitrogen permease regulator 2-like protein
MDENWDLTMQRIVPHINGVNSVKQIANLANTDFSLTIRALKHLLYYGCLLLLDIFSFSAIYAPTAQFSVIVEDKSMQRQCARYVNTTFAPGGPMRMGTAAMVQNDVFPVNKDREIVDGVAIVELYAALKQGQSVKQWHAEYRSQLVNIDVRRFITFGVIKGFLYRVHKYAYASGPRTVPLQRTIKFAAGTGNYGQASESRHSVYSETMGSDEEDVEDDEDEEVDTKVIAKYLDGTHCFDQICTELDISEMELTSHLKRYWEVQIIHR